VAPLSKHQPFFVEAHSNSAYKAPHPRTPRQRASKEWGLACPTCSRHISNLIIITIVIIVITTTRMTITTIIILRVLILWCVVFAFLSLQLNTCTHALVHLAERAVAARKLDGKLRMGSH